MPKVSEAHKDARRQQILAAATECFVANGFHRTGMREICQAANLSPGAVYNYFSGKGEIITGISEQSRERNAPAHERSRQANVPHPVETIFRDGFMASLRDPERLRQGVINLDSIAEAQRDAALRPLVTEAFTTAAQELIQTVREGQRRGELDAALDTERVAWMLLAEYLGLLALKLVVAQLDTDAVATTLLALLHSGTVGTATGAS